jgi:hypothetical protein
VRYSSVITFALLLSAWSAGMADAQTYRPERPYRGLFGSGTDDSQQSLTASGSIGAGWDNDLIADAAHLQSTAASDRIKGVLGNASGSLAYALNEERYAFGASAGTSVSYYPTLDTKQFVRREYLSALASTRIGQSVSVYGRAGYQPYSLGALYPGLFAPRPGEPVIDDETLPRALEHFFSYGAGGSWSRQLSRRGSLSADYGYRARLQSGSVDAFQSHSAGATYSHGLTRGLEARLGYHFVLSEYDSDARSYEHHIFDVGVNYSRALSFSRRTSFSFSTGTSATRRSEGSGLRYHATGSARLSHELGRTWEATAAYQRGVQFVESWPEPLLSDAVSAGIGGQLHRRVQFQALARAVHGTGQAGIPDNDVRSYRGTAQLAIHISRYMSGSVGYFFDRHDVGRGLSVPDDFPRYRDRQGVRASLTAWAPIFSKRKR